MKRIKVRTLSFTDRDAVRYGLNEAIFLQYLVYWVQKNERKKIGYYDERYWTYFTYEKLRRRSFVFWKNRRTLMRIIDSLQKQRAILVRKVTHHETGNRIFGGKAVSVTLSDEYLAHAGFTR